MLSKGVMSSSSFEETGSIGSKPFTDNSAYNQFKKELDSRGNVHLSLSPAQAKRTRSVGKTPSYNRNSKRDSYNQELCMSDESWPAAEESSFGNANKFVSVDLNSRRKNSKGKTGS